MENIEAEPTVDAEMGIEPETRLYEVGYLLLPLVTEENLSGEVEKIKGIIKAHGGTISSEGAPRNIELAYPMKKAIANKKTAFNKAYFGSIKFNASGEGTQGIKKALMKEDLILRFMIISTAEVIPQTPRPIRKRIVRRVENKEEPLDEAALDKELEELLIE